MPERTVLAVERDGTALGVRPPGGGVQQNWNPMTTLSRRWLDCKVLVLFDFSRTGERTERAVEQHTISLLPHHVEETVLFLVRRATLIQVGENKASIFNWRDIYIKLFQQLPKNIASVLSQTVATDFP